MCVCVCHCYNSVGVEQNLLLVFQRWLFKHCCVKRMSNLEVGYLSASSTLSIVIKESV